MPLRFRRKRELLSCQERDLEGRDFGDYLADRTPLYEDYEQSFNIVKSNIMAGNSYLTNLTNRVPVSCNLSLEEIFHRAKGKYKLLLRRKRTQAEDKAHLKEENIEENLTPSSAFRPKPSSESRAEESTPIP